MLRAGIKGAHIRKTATVGSWSADIEVYPINPTVNGWVTGLLGSNILMRGVDGKYYEAVRVREG